MLDRPRPKSAPKPIRPPIPDPVQIVVPASPRFGTPSRPRARTVGKLFSKNVRESVAPDRSRPPFEERLADADPSDDVEDAKARASRGLRRAVAEGCPERLYQSVLVELDEKMLVRSRACFVESFPRADLNKPNTMPPEPYPYTTSRKGPWRKIRVVGPLPKGLLPLTAKRGKEESSSLTAFKMDVELHRVATRRTQLKLVAFDHRRRTQRLHQHLMRARKVEEPTSPMEKSAQAKTADLEGVAAEIGNLFEDLDNGGPPSQVEVPFKVVRVSSQEPSCNATDLDLGSAAWETEVGHVKQEYIICQLEPQDKCAVDMVTLRLPGNDCNPKTCQVLYSTVSANGPFQEGWTFHIPSKATTSFRSSHTYVESHRHVEEFTATLREAAQLELETEDLVQAWCTFMEVDLDTHLSYGQFVQCIHKFLSDYDVEYPSWLFDLPQLFKHLDSEETGFVSSGDIARVYSRMGVAPQARWWKLVVCQNFGGKRINILGPLKLTRICQTTAPANARRGSVNPRKESLGQFFSGVEQGEVDDETLWVRELSRLHGLAMIDVEALFFKFRAFQPDSSQGLKEPQFKALVCDLFGAHDQWDIPAQRLQFFWQQADLGRKAEVSFEALVIWFRKYAGDVDLRRMRKAARR